MATIRLPNNWQPRHYQLPLWQYLQSGGKRGVAVWHRRSGKDDVALHWAASQAMQRPATYWHMLPEASQARKAIWEAINPHTGKRRIDEAFPTQIRSTTREQEMLIRFINGSTWQVVGSDNYDSLVGSPPAGITFSEYSISSPQSWAYLRPILAENGGWALFIYTPRGRNHGLRLYNMARDTEGWFADLKEATKTGVFSPEDLDRERTEYIAEWGEGEGLSRFRQEYLCSWEGIVHGAYYAMLMEEAESRITRVAYDPASNVETWWDLGIGDSTAIWFSQRVGQEIHLIDYYERSGLPLGHYVQTIEEKARAGRWSLAPCVLPHDAEARELQTGKSRVQALEDLGMKVAIVPRHNVDDGIHQVRQILPRCWFDAVRCEQGVEALRQYRAMYDEKRHVLSDRPLHDWTSHGADAFRYGAMFEAKQDRKLEPLQPIRGII